MAESPVTMRDDTMSVELDTTLDDARRLLEAGHREEAVSAFLRILEQSPGLPAASEPLSRIFLESGEAHYAARQDADASYFLGLALALRPGLPEAVALLGAVSHRQGVQLISDQREEEAEAMLRKALECGFSPEEVARPLATAIGMQANRLNDAGEAPGAMARLREALAIDPDFVEVKKFLAALLVNEAIQFYNRSLFPEAMASLSEALELDQASADWSSKVADKIRLQVAAPWRPDVAGRMVIPHLEMDVAYACNLHCDGCTHYSDYAVKGHVDFEKGREWLERWSQRVYPKLFRMLGGEPTLNPRLVDFILLAAKLWPATSCEVVSNGFFIDRHPGLFEALGETGTALQISVHEESEEYLGAVKLAKLKEASQKYGFSFSAHYGTDEDFYRLYKGKGPTMRPFEDGKPGASMAVCGNDTCTTLHLGRIWKCPPIAFLNNIEERFKLNAVPEWQPYLQHKGLSADASAEELRDYIRKTQYFCGMCPASKQGGSERVLYPV